MGTARALVMRLSYRWWGRRAVDAADDLAAVVPYLYPRVLHRNNPAATCLSGASACPSCALESSSSQNRTSRISEETLPSGSCRPCAFANSNRDRLSCQERSIETMRHPIAVPKRGSAGQG